MIVKPANGGSSIGINKAGNESELNEAIHEAKKYDKKIIIEKFIEACELECAVLKKDGKLIISNTGEIKAANNFYDYDAKYVNDESIMKMAINLLIKVESQIKEYAIKILKDFLVVDFLELIFSMRKKIRRFILMKLTHYQDLLPSVCIQYLSTVKIYPIKN